MESQESRQIAAPLAHRVEKQADAEQIAVAVVAIWLEIDTALAPIIGRRGIAALYGRSLYLTVSVHPWLANAHDGVQADMNLAGLKSVLAQQNSAKAAAAGDALLHTFYELLTTLVGPSLTERLLRSVWENSFSGTPPQDISP